MRAQLLQRNRIPDVAARTRRPRSRIIPIHCILHGVHKTLRRIRRHIQRRQYRAQIDRPRNPAALRPPPPPPKLRNRQIRPVPALQAPHIPRVPRQNIPAAPRASPQNNHSRLPSPPRWAQFVIKLAFIGEHSTLASTNVSIYYRYSPAHTPSTRRHRRKLRPWHLGHLHSRVAPTTRNPQQSVLPAPQKDGENFFALRKRQLKGAALCVERNKKRIRFDVETCFATLSGDQ